MQKIISLVLLGIIILVGFVITMSSSSRQNEFSTKSELSSSSIQGQDNQLQEKLQAEGFMYIKGQTFTASTSPIYSAIINKNSAVKFDTRSWYPVLVSSQDGVDGIRFMPKGNTKDNWKEAVDATQFTKTQYGSVSTFALAHKKEILSQHPNANFRVLKQNSSGIIYDWTVIGDKELGDYTVVGKIMMNENGIFHLYYMNKRTSNVAQTRMTFLKFIDNL